MSIKPYNVTIEVTTTYTVEVHAEDKMDAYSKAWKMDSDEVESQGSAEKTAVEVAGELNDVEEIQREDEEDE